jgi:hypothetical protein
VRANELDQAVLSRALGVTLAISLDVAQVTNMTGLIAGGTVGLVVRVDYVRTMSVSVLKSVSQMSAPERARTSREVRRRGRNLQ